jgi:hypothetical protein
VIQGTLPTACYADGMTRFLNARHIRIFDYFDFTKPLKESIRQNAERIAAEAGIEKIEFIRKLKAFRKEDRIQEILAERGDHPGLVCWSSDFDVHGRTVNSARNRNLETGRLSDDRIR